MEWSSCDAPWPASPGAPPPLSSVPPPATTRTLCHRWRQRRTKHKHHHKRRLKHNVITGRGEENTARACPHIGDMRVFTYKTRMTHLGLRRRLCLSSFRRLPLLLLPLSLVLLLQRPKVLSSLAPCVSSRKSRQGHVAQAQSKVLAHSQVPAQIQAQAPCHHACAKGHRARANTHVKP